MELQGLIWMAKALPEKSWIKNMDMLLSNMGMIVGGAIMAVVMVWTVVSTIKSYRRNRFCPNCRTKMVISWRTEKRGISNPRVRINGKGIKFSTGVDKIAVLRCPNCGREIDLGK